LDCVVDSARHIGANPMFPMKLLLKIMLVD
jgi:hypothetical protein